MAMKAMMCNALAEDALLERIEVPEPHMGPNDVLVRMRAASLNFPDVLMLAGRYQHRPDAPFIPGIEGAGEVVHVGAEVETVRPGDRVAVTAPHGAWAELVSVDADRCQPMPGGMDYATAAAFYLRYGTSWFALITRGQLKPGEHALVLGASSGVGLAAVDIGMAIGADMLACGSSEERLEPARAMGARTFVYPRSFPDKATARAFTDTLKALTPDLYDVIYDPVGGDYAEAAFRAIAVEGRHMVVGFAASPVIPKMPLNLPLLKGAAIMGARWGAESRERPETRRKVYAELNALWEQGRIGPKNLTIRAVGDINASITAMRNRAISGTAHVFEMDW